MARMIILLAALVGAVSAQNVPGLAEHNAQIQQHLAKEAEVQRLSGPPPQQYNNNYNNNYQQPRQQQQYQPNNNEDDGQYRPELYENQNNNYAPRSSNAQQDYQAGIMAHQAQVQNHLARQGSFQPQQQQGNQGAAVSDPAYQAGLQLHQRQIQNHLQLEQQHGGPQQAYQSQVNSYQAPQQGYQPRPQQYQQNNNNNNNYARGGGSDQDFQSGIALHMQQLLEHSRTEQQQQSLVGQASQYHQSQDGPQNYRG